MDKREPNESDADYERSIAEVKEEIENAQVKKDS
jgi:hypothetical protein